MDVLTFKATFLERGIHLNVYGVKKIFAPNIPKIFVSMWCKMQLYVHYLAEHFNLVDTSLCKSLSRKSNEPMV